MTKMKTDRGWTMNHPPKEHHEPMDSTRLLAMRDTKIANRLAGLSRRQFESLLRDHIAHLAAMREKEGR